MVRIGKGFLTFLVLVCTLIMTSCGGGGGSDPAPPSPTPVPTGYTLSGLATKGPVKNGNVSIYRIDAQGQKVVPALVTVPTDDQGNYTAAITYDGPVILEVSGGTYRDEATGVEVVLTQPLRACLPAVTADTSVAITPMTEVAVRMAESSGLSAESIASANAQVSGLLGCDIVTTQPAPPDDADAFGADTPEAQNYAIALAAISQMAETAGEDVFAVIDAIEQDAQDEELDTIGDDFVQAVETFLASAENNTGVDDIEDIETSSPTITKKYCLKQSHVTYRIYESGQPYVIATIEATKLGGVIAEADISEQSITSAASPPLTPDADAYYLLQYIGLDCSSVPGSCTHLGTVKRSGIWGVFSSLDTDTYTLSMTMENGRILAASSVYPGETALPYVTSASMTAQWSVDNLVLSWTNPTSQANWDQVDFIRIIANDNLGNETLHVSLPANSQTVTLSASLLSQAAALLGGTAIAEWQIQTLALDDSGMNYAVANSDMIALPAKQYAVSETQIGYRNYESGVLSAVAFNFVTDNGGPSQADDIITSTITNAAGTAVTPVDGNYYQLEFLYLDCMSTPGSCAQVGTFYRTGRWTSFNTLPADTYTYTLGMANGQTLSQSYAYPGDLMLPYVSSTTMSAAWSGDDLVLSWTNPSGQANWNETDRLRVDLIDNLGNDILYAMVMPDQTSITIPAASASQAAALLGGTSVANWRIISIALDENGMDFARGYSLPMQVPAKQYATAYPAVTYRYYEGGGTIFLVFSDVLSGGSAGDPEDVSSLAVTNGSGDVLSPLETGSYELSFMWMDCWTTPGTCTTAIPIYKNGVWASFAALDTGTYNMQMDMANGQSLTASSTLPEAVALPIVDSSTMTSAWNAEDLVLTWNNPTVATNWDSVDQLRVVLYDDQGYDTLYIWVPKEQYTITIPAAVIAQSIAIRGAAAMAQWQVQTIARDDNGMYYAQGYSAQMAIAAKQYAVSDTQISYRNYADSAPEAVIYNFVTENAGPIQEDDLTTATLTTSTGDPVVPNSGGFFRIDFVWLDCAATPGTCGQYGPFTRTGAHASFDTLAADTYTYTLEMANGQTLSQGYDYPGDLLLPYVNSETMASSWNGDDLVFSWTNPTEEENWGETDQLRIVLLDTNGHEHLYAIVPTDQTSVTIPAAALSQAQSLNGGEEVTGWRIMTMALDDSGLNFARGYSAVVPYTAKQYTVMDTQINLRNYADGTTRVVINNFTTESGGPTMADDVSAAVLTNSSGDPITPDNGNHFRLDFLWLDCMTTPGSCAVAGPFVRTGQWADFDTLAADTYTYTLEMVNGQTLSQSYAYPGDMVLPYVDAATMSSAWSGGNLVLSWANPTGAANWSETDQLRITLIDDQSKEVLYAIAGPDQTSVIIPGTAVAQAAVVGGGTAVATWQVQTMALDDDGLNFAKGYSAPKQVPGQYAAANPTVSYRSYEGGTTMFIAFSDVLSYGSAGDPTEVTGVALTNGVGEPLTPLNSGVYEMTFMWMDCLSTPGTCTAAIPVEKNGIWAMLETPAADTYGLEMTMANSQTLTTSTSVGEILAVPYVNGSTMTSLWSGGELVLSWTNPTADADWDAVNYVHVVLFDDLGNETLYLRLPTDQTTVTIPADTVAYAGALQGGTALGEWQVQTLALDGNDMNYARGYSLQVALSDPQYALGSTQLFQLRNFENDDVYMIAVSNVTDNSSPIEETDLLGMTIRDSAGTDLPASSTGFFDQHFLYVDCMSTPGTCAGIGAFEQTGGWVAFGATQPGSYSIIDTMDNGQILAVTKAFPGMMQLPCVTSASMEAQWDMDNNLALSWTNPDTDPYWGYVNQVRMTLYDEADKEVLYAVVSPADETVTIPADMITNALALEGSTAIGSWSIQTMAFSVDGLEYARGYSSIIPVTSSN